MLVVELVGHGRGDEAGRDGVHGDVAAGHFMGQRLVHADQARLGGGVIALPRIAHDAHDRGNADDAAEALLHHAPQHGAIEVEGGGEVDRDHLVPFLVLHAHEQVIARHAGIVDQDIEPAHGRFGRRNELVDLVELAEVCRQDRAVLADFLRRVLECANTGA
ncbi:hypothetical protein D3C72_1902580 [compost metagenome]